MSSCGEILKHERKTQNEERGGDTIEPFFAALLSEENNSKISILILSPPFIRCSLLSVSGAPERLWACVGTGCPGPLGPGASAKGELGPQRHRPPHLRGDTVPRAQKGDGPPGFHPRVRGGPPSKCTRGPSHHPPDWMVSFAYSGSMKTRGRRKTEGPGSRAGSLRRAPLWTSQ